MNKLLILLLVSLLVLSTSQDDGDDHRKMPEEEMYYEEINRSRFVKYNGWYEFHVRLYGSFVLATIQGQERNQAFSALESYFGRYTAPANYERMHMNYTLPYMREYPFDDELGVSLILPPHMNELSVAPSPVNDRIKLSKVEAGYWAIQPFTWSYKQQRGKEMLEKLIEQLKQAGILEKDDVVKKEDVIIAQFSEQLVPGPLKRNEVWVRIGPKKKTKTILL